VLHFALLAAFQEGTSLLLRAAVLALLQITVAFRTVRDKVFWCILSVDHDPAGAGAVVDCPFCAIDVCDSDGELLTPRREVHFHHVASEPAIDRNIIARLDQEVFW
jgi:hypothetical protein